MIFASQKPTSTLSPEKKFQFRNYVTHTTASITLQRSTPHIFSRIWPPNPSIPCKKNTSVNFVAAPAPNLHPSKSTFPDAPIFGGVSIQNYCWQTPPLDRFRKNSSCLSKHSQLIINTRKLFEGLSNRHIWGIQTHIVMCAATVNSLYIHRISSRRGITHVPSLASLVQENFQNTKRFLLRIKSATEGGVDAEWRRTTRRHWWHWRATPYIIIFVIGMVFVGQTVSCASRVTFIFPLCICIVER